MAFITVAGGNGFDDSFDGTGAIDASWNIFNQGSLPVPTRVSGKMNHVIDIGDNVGNDTAWFDGGTLEVGQLYHKTVTRPGAGTTYVYAVGIGIGPTSAPDNDLTVSGHNFSFMALICANTLSTGETAEWEHVSPGIRDDGAAIPTIERKTRQASSNSVQNDIGTTSPNTKFNLRLGIPSTGPLTWDYQEEGQDPEVDAWTDLTSGWPGSPTRITPGATVEVGWTAYSYDSEITSGEEFTGVIDRIYMVEA